MIILPSYFRKRYITYSEFETVVKELIKRNFKDHENFFVMEERNKYKAIEDYGIYLQEIGKSPLVCEVYYKGNFLCDIRTDMSVDYALSLLKRRYNEMLEEERKKKDDNQS